MVRNNVITEEIKHSIGSGHEILSNIRGSDVTFHSKISSELPEVSPASGVANHSRVHSRKSQNVIFS